MNLRELHSKSPQSSRNCPASVHVSHSSLPCQPNIPGPGATRNPKWLVNPRALLKKGLPWPFTKKSARKWHHCQVRFWEGQIGTRILCKTPTPPLVTGLSESIMETHNKESTCDEARPSLRDVFNSEIGRMGFQDIWEIHPLFRDTN